MKQPCVFIGSAWMVATQLFLMYGSFPSNTLDFNKAAADLSSNPNMNIHASASASASDLQQQMTASTSRIGQPVEQQQQQPQQPVEPGTAAENTNPLLLTTTVLQQPVQVQPLQIAPWLIPPKNDAGPGLFLLESVKENARWKYGAQLPPSQSETNITSMLQNEICDNSPKSKGKSSCTKDFAITKCTTCSSTDGAWYVGGSATGSAMAHTYTGTATGTGTGTTDTSSAQGIQLSAPLTVYRQIDIVVPAIGQEPQVQEFAKRLGKTMKAFRSATFNGRRNEDTVRVRLVLPSSSQLNKSTLATLANLGKTSSVLLVRVDVASGGKFNRAQVINRLFAASCRAQDCLVMTMDVDMDISTSFFYNAMSLVQNQASVYFPVVWSTFNPKTVSLVEDFYEKPLHRSSTHSGTWRPYGYGMMCMTGWDAHLFQMDETFVGWGGEDNEFFGRLLKDRHVIRMQEKGLTHLWHPKLCDKASFVDEAKYRACVGSASSTEGSTVGLYLSRQEVIQDARSTSPRILIAVTTSRKMFGKRVSAIMSTWAKDLPDHVLVRFFVGEGAEQEELGSIEALAKSAGLEDASLIHVTPAKDDEYPPVRKNIAMLQAANDIVSSALFSERPIGWVFKVDDDTYVNTHVLQDMIGPLNPSQKHVLGKRGTGRPADKDGLLQAGLTKPFCMGGPGYIWSQATLQAVAPTLSRCATQQEGSKWHGSIWHSDTIIGMCVLRQTGLGCWDGAGRNDLKTRFLQFYNDEVNIEAFQTQLASNKDFVSVHPLKAAGDMQTIHDLQQGKDPVSVEDKAAASTDTEAQASTDTKEASTDNQASTDTKETSSDKDAKAASTDAKDNSGATDETVADGPADGPVAMMATVLKRELIIPQVLLDAAEKYPDQYKDPLRRIRRWHRLGQYKIVDKLVSKALKRIEENSSSSNKDAVDEEIDQDDTDSALDAAAANKNGAI